MYFAGFLFFYGSALLSKSFHGFSTFSYVFMCFHGLPGVPGRGCLKTWNDSKEGPAAPYRNICSIPGWLQVFHEVHEFPLFFMNSYRFSCIYIDFQWFSSDLMDFPDLHCFSKAFVDFQESRTWAFEKPGPILKERPAAPIETFARFQAGFWFFMEY